MYRALVFAALLGVAAAVPAFRVGHMTFASEEEALFQRFKNEFGRVYFDAKDEDYRMQVFLDNHRMITQHNLEAEQGEHTYTLAMNEFGDMTFEEFHKKYTGFAGERSPHLREQNTEDLSHIELAASVDWTTKGAVTAVKNQGQCGSCWSFSATGAIEGATFLATGKLPNLSEQQLMDCSKSLGNNSCEGGLMDYAFEWVIRNGGITSESAYPYTARDSFSCKSASSVASIRSYKDVSHSETALAQAVTQQPVAVAIEADQSSFQFYSSGVMTGSCGTRLDHGVLAVGYGTLGGTEYWKVKNSWGGSWGMNGYILMEKGKKQNGGQCGILLSASYPVV